MKDKPKRQPSPADKRKWRVLIPKTPDANPDDKDALGELGPNEPLPEWVLDNVVMAFAEPLRDLLVKNRLTVDDIGDSWEALVRAFLGHSFGDVDSTDELRQIVKGVLETKFARLKERQS
jgi:hypothetical protein